MAKHTRIENPERPNTIIQMGARPLPDGNVETMVIIRLFDVSYQLSKVMSLHEYTVTLEGLDLCARQAIHQAHQLELRAAADESATSSPKSEYAPAAAPVPSSGSSMPAIRDPGAHAS